MGVIVVDTTVLLYAVGKDHALQEPCRRFVDMVGDGLRATTTVEVIQEFAHVRSRRRTRHDAARLARYFAGLMSPLLSPTAVDLIDGLALFEGRADLGSFDSVLAAVCVRRSMTLASADRSFAGVRSLSAVVPGTPEFDALLG